MLATIVSTGRLVNSSLHSTILGRYKKYGFIWESFPKCVKPARDLGKRKVKFGSKKAIWGVICFFRGLDLVLESATHPHMGKLPKKKNFYTFPNMERQLYTCKYCKIHILRIHCIKIDEKKRKAKENIIFGPEGALGNMIPWDNNNTIIPFLFGWHRIKSIPPVNDDEDDRG